MTTLFLQTAVKAQAKSPEPQSKTQEDSRVSANVNKNKEGRVTVTGTRIKQATLPVAVIKSLSSDKRFAPFVTIKGSSMAAANGYMLVKLKKSGILVVINDKNKDSAGSSSEGATVRMESASRTVTSLTQGIMVEIRTCSCGGDRSDVCQFGHKANDGGRIFDTDACAGESCCRITCLRVDRYGNIYDCESAVL